MPDRRPIVYYVTAHGNGHGARSCDILQALHQRIPDQPLIVVTDLPDTFLNPRLASLPVVRRPGSFDVGLVQIDSIRADVNATLVRLEALYRRRRALVAREARFLAEVRAELVVVDIPAIPLEAARVAGCPAVAVGNFGWDWIYGAFRERDPAWGEFIEAIEEGYRSADLLIRLPFSEPMSIFPRQVKVGVTARAGRPDRGRLAALTGADPNRQWVLLSFSTLDWDAEAVARVGRIPNTAFFTVKPLAWEGPNLFAVDSAVMPFADILATCDKVVSKPGYGIVAECCVNRKPLLYADREDFLEYPILVDAIQSHLVQAHVPAEHLYRGRLADGLDALDHAPLPGGALPADGSEQAARILQSVLDQGGFTP